MKDLSLRLRDHSYHVGNATLERAADTIDELVAMLLRWQAAWDWAGEEVIANASPALLAVAEDTDATLRAFGIREASNSVHLKQYTVELDASGRNTSALTRTGLTP